VGFTIHTDAQGAVNPSRDLTTHAKVRRLFYWSLSLILVIPYYEQSILAFHIYSSQFLKSFRSVIRLAGGYSGDQAIYAGIPGQVGITVRRARSGIERKKNMYIVLI